MTVAKVEAGVIQVPLIFLGLGNIGGTLLRQILSTREILASRTGLRLVPVAVADVSGVLLAEEGLAESVLEAALQATANGGTLHALPGLRPLPELAVALRQSAILSDLTASPATAPVLWDALDAGCGVVLANKVPLAGPWATSRAFLEHPLLRYEVTVGAGLPVIDALHYLRDTGDRVTLIEGCLSGTLGYLCAELERGMPYSTAVAQARAQGFTEPDPRDDLSGKDVARKSLILARTAGWTLEEASLTVEALYPDSLASLSTDEFLTATPMVDADYASRVAAAQAEGKVLRYVARVTAEGGTVGLVAVDREGPLGALRGPANYIALHTARYDPVPMVISGPGAGREVTAAGVLGDIIKLAQRIVCRE
ncbi:MAG: homoserine dehydrogenase [Anaerolineae bacterium]|nr:homoserine dehydrogenase [Anaerolineae bacterium]